MENNIDMCLDEEFETFLLRPDRIKTLGFKPQKEAWTNHLLPYADKLDEESNRFLEQVKTNLAKAVMLREMKPACGVWSSRLIKYIRMYGLKFSKEDHIALIKLAYELITIPDLEPCKVHKFATMFFMLTKKRHLISPEELTLPWRPLYDLGKRIFDKSTTHCEMYHYLTPNSTGNERTSSRMFDMIRKYLSGEGLDEAIALFGLFGNAERIETDFVTSLEGSYLSMVKCAKVYFDLDATKEILAECLPQISPWSGDGHLMDQLYMFLPVTLPPRRAARGHELWLDRLMDLWDTCYNSPCGVTEIMMLFTGLAKRNPGSVDWTPYVPKMFTRFLRTLNLPVSYKEMQFAKTQTLDTKIVASWIVWTINPDGVVLKHLRSFIAGVESYLHNANSGRWSFRLRDLLKKLSKEFHNRVRREREKKYQKSWENKTPEAYKLRDEDITEFVNILIEPTIQAVYYRNGPREMAYALQNLASLRPAIVIPPIIERLRTSLNSLTEPHKMTAAMTAVAAVARPMLKGADTGYPEGPTHVVPLLMAVLPGLDPNDMRKTFVSLQFILVFSCLVPFIDCSSAHEHWPDLTEEELLTCESTAQMEDFILIFLDRLFAIIESSVFEQARIDIKDTDGARSKTDSIMESALSFATTTVLMQCSPKIFDEALRKFKSFATDTTFETSVSGSMIATLLRCFAQANPEATLAAVLPKLCEELQELLSSDETLHDENPPRELVYRLVLLKQAVDCDGAVLLKYMPQIIPVLDRALKLHSKYAVTRATEILSHIFASLCSIDVKETKSVPLDYSAAPEKWLPIREWGNGVSLQKAALKWHMPTAEEAECAQMLVDRYLKPELVRLRQWLDDERPICRERRMRCFYIISAVLSCGNFMPPPDEKPVYLMESQVPATSLPFTTGVDYTVSLDGKNVRASVTELMLEVQARMLADKADDARGLEMLTSVWERVVSLKGHRMGPGLESRMRAYSALERGLEGRSVGSGCGGLSRPRVLLADAARLQDDARAELACEAGATPSVLRALHALYELSVNTYSSVRILAQMRLYWMLGRYPYSYRSLVPKLEALLVAGGEGDEWHARHKGALFVMLGPRSGPLVAKQDWEVVRALWTAVLKAPLSEKPIILKLEQAFSDALHRHFPAVNTRLTFPQAAVDAARAFLTDQQLDELAFKQALHDAPHNEKEASDKRERTYKEFVEELVDIAETPNIQWRRLELVMQMLTYCPSLQTAYAPRAVRLVARSLLHDDVAVRRTAQRLAHMALKQRKRTLRRVHVDPYQVAGVPRPDAPVPGYRKDLEWVMYDGGKVPETDEEWDKPWLRNPYCGFYAWPEKLEVAAPARDQKFSSDVPPEEMEEGERYLFEFFSDDANVDRLVRFLTAEEKKGVDKFNGVRFSMFKTLFAQFGEQIADKFIAHALRCAADTHEAPQRFAAEIAAAMLRAPRYWSRERALSFYDKAMDIIQIGLTNVTPESMEDWGTCLATGAEKLDPRRAGGVLARLLRLCAPPPPPAGDGAPASAPSPAPADTSFAICARLFALQGALGSLTWRGAPLAAELLRRLEAARFLQHPYQNVRDAVGSILMTIFDTELVFPGGQAGPAPSLARFLDTVQPRLAALYDENGDIMIKPAALQNPGVGPAAPSVPAPATPARPARGSPAPPAPAVPVAGANLSHREHAPLQPGEGSAESSPEPGALRDVQLDKQLAEQLESAIQLAGDAAVPGPADHADAVNLLTTVLRGLMGVSVRGVWSRPRPLYALAGTACALGRGPPQPLDELARAADGFLASLALADHAPDAFDAALRTLHELAAHRSWWARLACVHFAQPLLFYGLPLLAERAPRAHSAEAFTLRLMRDPRLEVRQAAAKLLTGLMHCCALPDEERTLRDLRKSCRSDQLVERHCGVLGLCAYLSSRPYSLGPKIGEVLAELSRHSSAPDPLPSTIRGALADFRRTHQDEWPRHRDRLTADELDLLADLTSPPSYCA